MVNNFHKLCSIISLETGLDFEASSSKTTDGCKIILLIPRGYIPAHTFRIEAEIAWRRLGLRFVPGTFAGPLLQAMSSADISGRALFKAILSECERLGGTVSFSLDGLNRHYDEDDIWGTTWRRLSMSLSKGNLELGAGNAAVDFEIIQAWTVRFVAAVVALLPLEEYAITELQGCPEGALQTVVVNRYERDRRNRAAALAIHGHACLACGIEFGKTYGSCADGYIEVHHVVPVSELGESYVIDPKEDLVPLCPNCHAVAHLNNPPFTVKEIKRLLQS